MTRSDGETKKERRWQWIAGFGVVLILGLLGTNIATGVAAYKSQDNHHAASTRQNTEIITLIQEVKVALADHSQTLGEIQTLETEVASVIEGLPAADAELAQFARWLEVCIGTDHSVGCPAPPIPSSN